MKKDKIYIDTNVFVALHFSGHKFYDLALNLKKRFIGNKLYLGFLTIDEILYTLSKYKISKKDSINIIKRGIVNSSDVTILPSPFESSEVLDYLYTYKKTSLKPRDSLHLYLMKINKIKKIATFDNDFIKKQKELGIEVLN